MYFAGLSLDSGNIRTFGCKQITPQKSCRRELCVQFCRISPSAFAMGNTMIFEDI